MSTPPLPLWGFRNEVPLIVYEGDRIVCYCHDPEDAARLVAGMNLARAEWEGEEPPPPPPPAPKPAPVDPEPMGVRMSLAFLGGLVLGLVMGIALVVGK